MGKKFKKERRDQLMRDDADKNILRKKFVMQVATRNYLDEIRHDFLGVFSIKDAQTVSGLHDEDNDSDARSQDSTFSHTNMHR